MVSCMNGFLQMFHSCNRHMMNKKLSLNFHDKHQFTQARNKLNRDTIRTEMPEAILKLCTELESGSGLACMRDYTWCIIIYIFAGM